MAKITAPYDGPVVTRAEARAAHLTRYFTSNPCKNGHLTERETIRGKCLMCLKTKNHNWYLSNIDRHMALNMLWQNNNKERLREIANVWARKNRKKLRVKMTNRRARIKRAGGRHSVLDIDFLFGIQKGRCGNSACRATLKHGYHVDHMMPLALGGSNARGNIQLLCAPCNLRKNSKHPIVWAQQNGMLL